MSLGAALGVVLWTVLGPAGSAGATTQSSNVSTTVSVACSVALSLGNTTLGFGTVAPGQTSAPSYSSVNWTDTCGSTFSGVAAVTDLVDYGNGPPTTATTGTLSSCGGSVGCIPAYSADIGITIGTVTCELLANGSSCGSAVLPTKGTFTDFSYVAGSCVDVTPGSTLTCPDTLISGTAGGYGAGEYAQQNAFTLHVPADAQTQPYVGWVVYTITG